MIADGSRGCFGAIIVASLEIIWVRAVLGLHVVVDGLDHGSAVLRAAARGPHRRRYSRKKLVGGYGRDSHVDADTPGLDASERRR